MEENQLDRVIENAIKNSTMKADMREPVMDRVAAYEMKKARGSRLKVFLSYIYTFSASLVTLVLLFNASQYLSPHAKQFPGIFSLMRSAIQGVFVFLLVSLLTMGIYYLREARKRKFRFKS